MSATVTYKGQTLTTIASGSKTLQTARKWLESDIVITESGGASNIVKGTFKGTTTGATLDVTLNYSGSGYPILVAIFPTEGAYNSTTGTWYNSTQRYAIGEWYMSKARIASAPTYATSGATNYGCTAWVYKNNASSATTYSRSSAMSTNTYTTADAGNTGATACRIKSKTSMQVFIASTSYGFQANIEYTYYVVYSS